MNREAAALGTPVYTTFTGRLGGVDEALIRSGRLRPLTDPPGRSSCRSEAPATVRRRSATRLCSSTSYWALVTTWCWGIRWLTGRLEASATLAAPTDMLVDGRPAATDGVLAFLVAVSIAWLLVP